ncbi:syntaxin-1A-like [Stegodyphus dumicola]|uniref:syntaxin-1A-like n=1 Tax=Stegodyphus dumicola TaxID=202533 RepID=UPI0015ABD2D6|nr:syntaxin-1A-like [Stegodyphus dumicola]
MFAAMDQRILDVIDTQQTIIEFFETDESLYSIYNRTKKGLHDLANCITRLENYYRSRKLSDGVQLSDTEIKLCNIQILTVKQRLTSSVSNYYNIQEEYINEVKERIKRQAQIAGIDISKINFDEAIENQTDIFMQTVLPDYNIAHHYLAEIKKRHEEFLQLEKSIIELRDLFSDMALIVQVDHVLMDRIDKHGHLVSKIVIEGNKSVFQYSHSKKVKKIKRYFVYGCAAFIAVIVLLSILSALR